MGYKIRIDRVPLDRPTKARAADLSKRSPMPRGVLIGHDIIEPAGNEPMTTLRASPIAGFRPLAGVLVCLAACLTGPPVQAQSAENVAIIVNDNSQDSRRIGEYYARVRNLPLSNVLRIQTSTDDQIERDAYVKTIEQPLGVAIKRAALQDRLLYLVLTKGVPLRVAGTAGVDGTMASVDSELTLLYRRMAGQPTALEGKIDNPYYLGAREIGEAR